MVRNHNLRWKITKELAALKNVIINDVQRRAKYILMNTNVGTIMIHLGMSGRLSVLMDQKRPDKHDHVDFNFINANHNLTLRYTDPRRFGTIQFIPNNRKLNEHPLLSKLGVEPLSEKFNAEYLYHYASKRNVLIKQLIMNQHVVVGVGNIYASEALFLAKISPLRKSNSLQKEECKKLVEAIKKVLKKAIKSGGTTLRDFLSPDGNSGYFSQKLLVYDRKNEPCVKCKSEIKEARINQRSTYFCQKCQK